MTVSPNPPPLAPARTDSWLSSNYPKAQSFTKWRISLPRWTAAIQDGLVTRPQGWMKLTTRLQAADVIHTKKDDSYHLVLRNDGLTLRCSKAQAEAIMQHRGKGLELLTCVFECPEILLRPASTLRLYPYSDDTDFYQTSHEGGEGDDFLDVQIDREAIEQAIEEYVAVIGKFTGKLTDFFIDDSPRPEEADDLTRHLNALKYPDEHKDD